ncbi:hypothetical protein V6Z11_D12G250400 [Gossypium hirsutum]
MEAPHLRWIRFKRRRTPTVPTVQDLGYGRCW